MNVALAAVRAFGSFLQSKGFSHENPAGRIRTIRLSDPLAPQGLTRQEEAALLRGAGRMERGAHTEAQARAVLLLMLQAGLRISEVSALNVSDITLSQKKGMVIIRRGKWGSQREVPLNLDVRDALKVWMEVRPKVPTGSLFGLTKDALDDIVRKAAYAGRVENVHPHRLRHTFALNLINAGVPITQVARLLGHKHIEQTMRYTVPSEDQLASAVERVAWR